MLQCLEITYYTSTLAREVYVCPPHTTEYSDYCEECSSIQFAKEATANVNEK